MKCCVLKNQTTHKFHVPVVKDGLILEHLIKGRTGKFMFVDLWVSYVQTVAKDATVSYWQTC